MFGMTLVEVTGAAAGMGSGGYACITVLTETVVPYVGRGDSYYGCLPDPATCLSRRRVWILRVGWSGTKGFIFGAGRQMRRG